MKVNFGAESGKIFQFRHDPNGRAVNDVDLLPFGCWV
jgi:hypothetical protein